MFYKIDYEQLNALAGVVCEQLARRAVEGDRIEVVTVHTADPENTSFSEQQTGAVFKEAGIEDICELPAPETGPIEGRNRSGTMSAIAFLSPSSLPSKELCCPVGLKLWSEATQDGVVKIQGLSGVK